jgi:hypothetical protein
MGTISQPSSKSMMSTDYRLKRVTSHRNFSGRIVGLRALTLIRTDQSDGLSHAKFLAIERRVLRLPRPALRRMLTPDICTANKLRLSWSEQAFVSP